MPVKVKKQLDPTAELIRQLQEENAKLQAQLASMGSEDAQKSVPFLLCWVCLHLLLYLFTFIFSFAFKLFLVSLFFCCVSTFLLQEIEKERREWEEKLAAADRKVSDSQKALEDMKANAESNARVHLVRSKTGVEEETLTVEELEAKVRELEDLKNNSDGKLEELLRLVSCWVWKWWDVGDAWFKPVVVWFEFTFQQEHCFGFGFLSFFTWICHETRPFYTGAQELNIEISKLQAKIQELGGPEEAPQESLEVRVGKLYSQLFFKVCVTEPREKASINH